MKFKYLIFGIIILLLILSLGFSVAKIYCRPVLTTDLEKDTPVNDLVSISLNTEKIHLYTYWFNLTINKQYEYKVAIFDGKKNMLYLTPVTFKPTETTWQTITSYPINAKIDKPGKWTFEMYLDNKLMFRKTLKVNPGK